MKAVDKPRALVVEQEQDTAQELSALLADRFGAEVETATSLRAARQALTSGSFDLVTIAYMFTDGTGLELLREMTSRKGHPAVIMVTGRGNEEVASEALREGVSGYVLKDDSMAANLEHAVGRALEQGTPAQAREALQESEAFYRTLFEESIDALFIETLDGQIEDANRSAAGMLGYEPGELQGMNAANLVPQERMGEFESVLEKLLAGEKVEFENLHRDGRRVPVTVAAKEVMTRRGARYLVSVRDLSELRSAQKDLASEKAVIGDVLDNIGEIFVLVDTGGRYIRWNAQFGEITGYSDDEIGRLSLADVHPHHDIARIQAANEAVLATGAYQRLETAIITKDGTSIPYEISAALVRDHEGRPAGIAGIGRDVSERKRTDEALRTMVMETNERREEITALLEATRMVLEKQDFSLVAGDIFRICRGLIGAGAGFVATIADDRDEVLLAVPEGFAEVARGARHIPAVELYASDLELGNTIVDNDFRASALSEKLPESHFRIQNILIAPLILEGEVGGMIALANKEGGFSKRDSLMASAFGEIASLALQNSRYLDMLSDSEERFRSVAATANEAIICSDSQGSIVFWNPGAERIFGWKSDEVAAEPLTMILPERLRKSRMESMLKALDSAESPGRTYETTGLRKDTTEFDIEVSRSAPWRVGDEIFFTLIIRDTTERVQAEEALRRSEAQYRAIVEDQTELINRYRPSGPVVFVNEANARYFGMTTEQMMALESWLPLVYEEDLEYVQGRLAEMTRENPVVTLEHRVIDGTGEVRWQQWTNRGFYDDEGDLVEVQAVGRDITDRKVAEEALRASEQRYRMLFDTAPDVIYTLDDQGRLTSLSAGFERVTGFSRSEWMGQSFIPLVHPDDLGLAIQTFERSARGETVEPYELRIMTKSGAYRAAEFISRPLALVDGTVGEFGIGRDITARREAEEALAESEDLYRGLLATSPDAVVVTDLGFNVTMVSDSAVRQQGAASADELIGLNSMEMIPLEQRNAAEGGAQRTIETGLGIPMELNISRRDGTSFVGEVMASLLHDKEGRPRGFMATIRDVTERKRAEQELQMLNNELEGYAHAVSHDLKGPLASLSAAGATIQSLLKGDLDAQARAGIQEMGAIIENNVARAVSLVDDLLELAEVGQRPFGAEEVDIGEIVEGIIHERRVAIKDRHMKVKTGRSLGKVVASPAHMYQLFSNLIDNSIKYNDSRKPVLEVEYLGLDEMGGHRYMVRDNGPGIPEGQEEAVFVPFVSTAEGTSGLGLATVQKIAGIYGGTATVQNDDGARFEFVIHDAP